MRHHVLASYYQTSKISLLEKSRKSSSYGSVHGSWSVSLSKYWHPRPGLSNLSSHLWSRQKWHRVLPSLISYSSLLLQYLHLTASFGGGRGMLMGVVGLVWEDWWLEVTGGGAGCMLCNRCWLLGIGKSKLVVWLVAERWDVESTSDLLLSL